MRILLDVDGVLGDFPSCALRWLNGRAWGRSEPATIEQITQHDILKAFGVENLQDAFDQWCADTDVCRHMPVYEGAQAFVEELKSFADVVIVTARYKKVPNWTSARDAWLVEHFAIDPDNVIHAKRKECVFGEVLIDDKLKNVAAWQNAWPRGLAVVLDRPWNRGGEHARAHSYQDALGMVKERLV